MCYLRAQINRRHSIVARIVGMTIMLLCAQGCSSRPPVKVAMSGDTAKVSVETLGEYPTTITRARLRDESMHSVVWEVEANHGAPQIHWFVLKSGINSASGLQPIAGSYKIVTPQKSESFELLPNRPHQLDLWSQATGSSASVGIEFSK